MCSTQILVRNTAYRGQEQYKLDSGVRGQEAASRQANSYHDYLVVPTATMATSAAEIKRFTELGHSVSMQQEASRSGSATGSLLVAESANAPQE